MLKHSYIAFLIGSCAQYRYMARKLAFNLTLMTHFIKVNCKVRMRQYDTATMPQILLKCQRRLSIEWRTRGNC